MLLIEQQWRNLASTLCIRNHLHLQQEGRIAQHNLVLDHPHWGNPNPHRCSRFVQAIRWKQQRVHRRTEDAADNAHHHDHRLQLHLHIQNLCRVTATVEEEMTIHGKDTFHRQDDVRWTNAHQLKPRLKLHFRRKVLTQSGSLLIHDTQIFANNRIIDLKMTSRMKNHDADETLSKNDAQWPDTLRSTTQHIEA